VQGDQQFDLAERAGQTRGWATATLTLYGKRTGIPAKLVVVGVASNGFSIADPDDAGMLDVVGFDTAAPQVMGQFAADDGGRPAAR
jgi:hypothetical protein